MIEEEDEDEDGFKDNMKSCVCMLTYWVDFEAVVATPRILCALIRLTFIVS